MRSPEDRPMTSATRPSAALKRKQLPDEAGAGRATKHRAAQACQYCRIRKVRCDVLLVGAGCTNCRLDSRECIVLASRRGRVDCDQKGSTTEIPKSPVSQWSVRTSDSTSSATREGNRSSHGTMPTPTSREQAGACDVPVCVTFAENDEHDYSTTDHTPSRTHDGTRLDSHSAISNPVQTHQSPAGMAPLPAFFTPLSTSIPSEDLDFLVMKGAFTVPEAELRAEILRGYIFSVHPFMPLLDLKPFVEAVLDERTDNPISLLLFQAVMFAGLSSLEPHFVLRLGFVSAKQARAVFYTRVKLLYEFDVEPDRAAVCQSLLLMSSWYSQWNEGKDTWHWTAQALLAARNMGLHREPTRACGSDRQRRFRRRLWWSLYIRDRMIALGTRRPMQVRDTDFDVTMLTLADFDLEPLDDSINGRRLTPDAKENQCTALMCIELAKLCVCIGHVLSSQYTTLSTHPDVPHTMMVVPRRDGQRIGELERFDKEINDWLRSFSSNIRGLASSTVEDGSHSCSEVHWAMLNMTHLTLVNVLHRTQALQALSDTADAHAVQRASRSKVKDAARNVTKIAYGMLRRDQFRFLGLNGITALLAACLSHMVDIRSGDEDVRDANIFRFNQSMQVLQAMRSMYATADAAVCFLASVIRKAGISVQPQIAMPAQDFMSASTEGLGQATTTGKQSSDWGDPPATHDRRNAVSRGHSDAGGSYSARIPPPPTPLLDPDRHVLPVRSEMRPALMTARVNAFTDAFPASSYASTSSHGVINTTEGGPMRDESLFHFVDRPPRNLSSSAANKPFMGCNSSPDFAMDFDPIAIDDDFQSETFGFLDSQFQGI